MAAVRVGKLTASPAGLTFASISVHAAKEESKKQRVQPEELPIYTPPPLQSKYVEEQPGNLQMGFASIRTTTGRYIGWCKGVYVFVKNGILDTVQFGKDAYVYLKNPPRDFLPKLGVITVSGLAGLLSARKGSRFKKITYPLGLATLGATVCYPVSVCNNCKARKLRPEGLPGMGSFRAFCSFRAIRPAHISSQCRVTGKKAYATSQQIYEAVKSLWTKNNKQESLPEPTEKSKVQSSETEMPVKAAQDLKHSALPAGLKSEMKTKSGSISGAKQSVPDPKLMDHGQSHPEDADMYSTRS